MTNDYLRTGEENKCFGCSACETWCPTQAITMQENDKGFRYPVLDEKKCISCGKCNEVCPWHDLEEGKKIHLLYAAEHKSEDVLRKSQSGGVFTALSNYVLDKDGAVYGAVFDDNLNVVHARATCEEERDRMRESKYVQSIIGKEVLRDLAEDCKNKKYILFTGTPCQCAMVKKNYGENENLFVCELICHGVPSPKVWREYLEWREKNWGVNVCEVKFRNKRYRERGRFSESLFTEDGVEHISDSYLAIFYSHLAHRECCFTCPFATEIRYADITIGDFNDIALADYTPRYDLSMLFVNTERGLKLFDNIKSEIDCAQRGIQYYKNQPCLYHPVNKPENLEMFWLDYGRVDIRELLNLHVPEKIKRQYQFKFR